MAKFYRKFGGKKYKPHDLAFRFDEAQDEASTLRRKGYAVRIIDYTRVTNPTGSEGFGLFVRKKRRR